MTVNSLLPPNASKHERDIEAVISPPLSFPNRDIWNPDKCPEHLLPHLAWALSVDNWDSTWPVDRKRQVIKDSIHIHRKKGTRDAVERVVSAIRGDDTKVTEWFEDKENLQKGDFRVDYVSTDTPIDGSDLNKLIPAINSAKNVRSSLKEITITTKTHVNQNHSIVSRSAVPMKSGPWFISSLVSSLSLKMACLSRQSVQIKSGPLPLVE